MGFCRRCGDIVPTQSARCKCGGSAVAPVVKWNHAIGKGGSNPDRWMKTYVSNNAEGENDPTATPHNVTKGASPTFTTPSQTHRSQSNMTRLARPVRRFPKPLNIIPANEMSHHISLATSQRPASPVKRNAVLTLTDSPGSTDVITNPDNVTLAKAYGSVLQRPETLPIHTCASCSTVFLPDATIYPDPQNSTEGVPRFLCRACFAARGGSKGNCAICNREVLTVTKEGKFIENAGRVWHKRCFRCDGCDKEIGDSPMVDLLGRPSCNDCFDTCLDRRGSPKTKKQPQLSNNIGGMKGTSRESSPALEELSDRLGIKRSSVSESTNDVARHSQSLHMGVSDADGLFSQVPVSTQSKNERSPFPMLAEHSTRDISSDSTDSIFSHSYSTPATSPREPVTPVSGEEITPKGKGTRAPTKVVASTNLKCNRCSQPLCDGAGGGKIVTLPLGTSADEFVSYHSACFRCSICGGVFNREAQSQVTFARCSRGPCHPQCMALGGEASKSRLDSKGSPASVSPSHSLGDSPKYNVELPPSSAPPLTRNFPRFGGSSACPSCHKSVSPMEYGVVPGPQNTRWHNSCLVCGGKGSKPPRPGCGKRLDSAAKADREGRVWCRECMLLLPAGTCPSPQGSPTRGRIIPSYTGNGLDRLSSNPSTSRLFGQVTGNTFVKNDPLMVQFTGDPSQMRRGSVSPTRQMTRSASPTKGLIPVTRHPRPMGMWKHKSVDEGRGMFLVKQMTGNGL